MRVGGRWLAVGVVAALAPVAGWAHEEAAPIAGKKLTLAGEAGTKSARLAFQSEKEQAALLAGHDPADGFALLVRGTGPSGGRSELVRLDEPSRWKPIGKAASPKGWQYKDKTGSRGGVRKVVLKKGRLRIDAKGPDWSFVPEASQGGVQVAVRLGDQWLCAEFGGDVKKDEAGRFQARRAPAPASCDVAVCGNGTIDAGESCDDGNLAEGDGCSTACAVDDCEGESYATTFEAIQDVVFEGYGCTNGLCHGHEDEPAGELSLLQGVAYEQLVGAQATAVDGVRVQPGDKNLSFLYEKLAAATNGTPTTNAPMPISGDPLTAAHLEAVALWIEGGAPDDRVVAGTAELLASCLPPPDPLKIEPPEPPPAGAGLQLRSTGWPLPARSEREICMATWYDLTETALVPADAQLDCPGVFGPNNPSDKCFAYRRTTLAQDAQSHHAITHIYEGDYGPTDASNPSRQFGPWTYKLDDLVDAQNGQPCDPTDVDPALGYQPGCSGAVQDAVACIGAYGPPDFNTGGFGLFGTPTAPDFFISQEPHFDVELADGVYALLPMSGVVVWNSHAFNLTDGDTTMSQYMNLWLAGAASREHLVQRIFGADEIFTQLVPPFEQEEYCHTWTAPQGARVFRLSSHTHRHGIRWRTWGPPNAPCAENGPGQDTCGPGPDGQLIYESFHYADPKDLHLDPPIALDGAAAADRTFRFCALYDNGSTPESPSVKRRSTSPEAGFPIGGPCELADAACLAGPQKGQACGAAPDPDAFCDSAPGAGDGECDACPLRGGVTTEDEMFILLGNYWVE